MSETENATPAKAATPRTATLVRGRYYDCKGKVWNSEDPKMVTQTISEDEEEYLREHAVIVKTVDGQEFRVPRFEFSTDKDQAAPRVRSRRRPATAAAG